MVKKIVIYLSVLLLFFSAVSAAGSFAFATEDQSNIMPAGAVGGSADLNGLTQIQHAGLFSVTSWAKNVPNPFRPRQGEGTTIIYNISADTCTKLIIYDITGRAIWQKSFDPGEEGGKAGQNSVFWDGKNDFGGYVGNGIYIYMVISDSKILHLGHMAVMN